MIHVFISMLITALKSAYKELNFINRKNLNLTLGILAGSFELKSLGLLFKKFYLHVGVYIS